MMVRKKTSESEEKNQKDPIETTDNKNNTTGTSEIKDNQQEEVVAGEKQEDVAKTEAEEVPVSDKKIPEEKSFEEKLAEMQDKYLRLSAEFDNYRKRTLKEKIDISKYAGEEILISILPIIDDFERALKHMASTADCNVTKEGIDLIYNKLSDFLKQQGVKEIDSLNNDFNVDLHDAVAKIPVEEEEKKGRIVEVVSKGYYLKDKVIRHSKVVIGE